MLVDTDVGVDDALALMMVLAAPEVDVVGICGVAGNVGLDHVMRNIGVVLDAAGAPPIPIYRGCAGPLVGEHRDAGGVHGADGLGNTAFPPSSRPVSDAHAALAIVEASRACPDLTLLTLGPLTNVALAFRLDPEVPSRLNRLIVMGGTIRGQGNVIPAAEYNVWADPEAAHIVLNSGANLWLISWETTLEHLIPWGQWGELLRQPTPKARFARAITGHIEKVVRHTFRLPGFPIPDPLAAAVAMAPEAVRRAHHFPVHVELCGRHCRGQTIVDYHGVGGKAPNAHVVFELDMETIYALLERGLT
ncbi:MAG: nucleoside hydrolase [Ardenticatenia bacterium]|nr:nucleoside hydrolase [Ardenticatenia bacterium]